MNGLALYIIIGACNDDLSNMSPIVPPATLRKADPATPSRNRAISMVWIFCATAQGISQMTKNVKETT